MSASCRTPFVFDDVSDDVSEAGYRHNLGNRKKVIHRLIHRKVQQTTGFCYLEPLRGTRLSCLLDSMVESCKGENRECQIAHFAASVPAACHFSDFPLANHKIRRANSAENRKADPILRKCSHKIYRFETKAGKWSVAK